MCLENILHTSVVYQGFKKLRFVDVDLLLLDLQRIATWKNSKNNK